MKAVAQNTGIPQHRKPPKPGSGGWFVHPFEFTITGTPGNAKSAFITSIRDSLKAENLDCEYLGKISDQVFMEQKYISSDILLIDSGLELPLPHFLFLDSSVGVSTRTLSPTALEVERLLGIIGKPPLLSQVSQMPGLSGIPRFETTDIPGIIGKLRTWIRERTPPLATLLLCGGQSSRMGEDKFRISYHEEPQIVRMVKLLNRIGHDPVTVSVADSGSIPQVLESLASKEQITILPDRFNGFGPMGGILTALTAKPAKAWLVAAIDLPLLEMDHLSTLVDNRNPLKFATAFGTPLPEPLFTIYEPKSLPRMLALLGRGITCPRGFLRESPHQELGLPPGDALYNANTPEERDEAQKRLQRKRSVPPTGRTVARKSPLCSVVSLEQTLRGLDTEELGFPPPRMRPLKDSFGTVLATGIRADRDQPPFNRAAMDGIAVRSTDLADGRKLFSLRGILPAGMDPSPFDSPEPGQAVEIMTGAPLPEGYNRVIRYEYLKIENQNATVVSEDDSQGPPWKNVHRKGSDYTRGENLIPAGTYINSAVTATLASTGQSMVFTKSMPRITLLSTGNELVPIDSTPLDWQIRQSNISTLSTELKGWGITDIHEDHLDDDRGPTLKRLETAMNESPVLLLSGGVSKGKFDYVPDVLKELGVQILAHGVAQKPGKPLLVAILPKKCIVFAFPGNPVASLMSLRRFVIPFLTGPASGPFRVEAKNLHNMDNSTTHFLAANLENSSDAKLLASPLKGNGSGDFYHLMKSRGFIEVPEGFDPRNSIVDFYPWAAASQLN